MRSIGALAALFAAAVGRGKKAFDLKTATHTFRVDALGAYPQIKSSRLRKFDDKTFALRLSRRRRRNEIARASRRYNMRKSRGMASCGG